MAETLTLKAKPRTQIGRSSVKKVRGEGQIPAVLYGKTEPKAIQLNTHEVIKAFQHIESKNFLVDLSLEDSKQSHLALVQEIQMDPLKDTVKHIDFQEVDNDKTITAEVSLHPAGEAVGVKSGGGLLEQIIRSVKVECLPKALPSHVEADINNLELGAAMKIRDITPPEGVKILNQGELNCFIIHLPRSARAASARAAAEAKD
ncbi:MAG: 50S ribosomal protein L25 [Verrucomicrobiota bacterium]